MRNKNEGIGKRAAARYFIFVLQTRGSALLTFGGGEKPNCPSISKMTPNAYFFFFFLTQNTFA